MPYIVVENSGMVDEVDQGEFETLDEAYDYINSYYDDEEIDELFVRIAWEDENGRTYEW